jgi:hypothetical protein
MRSQPAHRYAYFDRDELLAEPNPRRNAALRQLNLQVIYRGFSRLCHATPPV